MTTLDALDTDDVLMPLKEPLHAKLLDEHLAVVAVRVQITFQQKKTGTWPFSSDTLNTKFVDRPAWYIREVADRAKDLQDSKRFLPIFKELFPLFASLNPEQMPLTLDLMCSEVRASVQKMPEETLFFIHCLLAGKTVDEIATQLGQLVHQKFDAQAFRQQITASSDKELFHLFQPLLSETTNLEHHLAMAADHERKQLAINDTAKIGHVFQQAIQEIRKKPDVVQITEARVAIMLVSPGNPSAPPTLGVYRISANSPQGWQWTQDKDVFSSMVSQGGSR